LTEKLIATADLDVETDRAAEKQPKAKKKKKKKAKKGPNQKIISPEQAEEQEITEALKKIEETKDKEEAPQPPEKLQQITEDRLSQSMIEEAPASLTDANLRLNQT